MMLDSAVGLGFTFQNLAERDGLMRLDQTFLRCLEAAEPALHLRLLAARAAPDALPAKDESALIIDLGPHLDAFVGELFGTEAELETLLAETLALDPVHNCKRLFVQRQAVKKYPDPSALDVYKRQVGTRVCPSAKRIRGGFNISRTFLVRTMS